MGYIVGLMSGTSLDGIDVALVNIKGSGASSKLELLDFLSIPFSEKERLEIEKSLSVETSDVRTICSLNFALGYKFAFGVKKICQKNNIQTQNLAVIGSHGQTIYHQTKTEDGLVPSTLQIGEAAVIAYETQALVVSNFRTMDIASGGQGAPLVPYTEWLLYTDLQKSRLLQNIGGIANVTVLPKKAKLEDIVAFDTGPGNMIIDEICQQLFDAPYDENGLLAKQGNINEKLLARCMDVAYITKSPPKSTGRELFGKEFAQQLIKENANLCKYDLLTTLTMFTAKSIVCNYQKFVFPHYEIDELIVGGGGSYNATLIRMLKELLAGVCTVKVQEEIGFSSSAKEAIAFAILANETLHGNSSNVPRATGAKSHVVLGNLTFPPGKNHVMINKIK